MQTIKNILAFVGLAVVAVGLFGLAQSSGIIGQLNLSNAVVSQQTQQQPVTVYVVATPTSEAVQPVQVVTAVPVIMNNVQPAPVVPTPIAADDFAQACAAGQAAGRRVSPNCPPNPAAVAPIPDTGGDMPTRITMPEIGLDAAIEPAEITQTPPYNVGWWLASQRRGDVVLFGHNYTALAPLVNVQPGQQMALQSNGGIRWYTVTWLETRPANGNVPDVVAGQVVLITCLPFPNGDTDRLIVYAQENK